ncbi:MAG: hypothetical protein HZB25_11645 [Candidatus Eisenbacteria bacterium]|nr:hypothetical protein [Candidatus Eisenbacteria bacterium]
MGRRERLCVVLCSFLALGAGPAGRPERLENWPFVFFAGITGGRVDRTVSLVVDVDGGYAPGSIGVAEIRLPDGVSLVSGSTTIRTNFAASRRPHTLQIKPTRTGHFDVVGILRVNSGTSYRDEVDIELPLEVRADSIHESSSHFTRMESVRGGQRYRYTREWLVPIDSSDAVSEFDRAGLIVKPQVVEELAALPSWPRGAAVDSLAFMVVVRRDGSVRDAVLAGSRARITRGVKDEAVAEVLKALKSWRFQPATVKGRPIEDWLYVTAPVPSLP